MRVDAHVHVSLLTDPVAAARAAAAAGVSLVGVAVDAADSRRNAELGRRCGYRFTVGLHPAAARDGGDPTAWLAAGLDAGAVGLGECGLDDACDVPAARQEEVLRAHCALAAARGVPLNLHVRKAHGRLLKILRGYDLRGGVIHGFTFSPELARAYVDLGLCLSAGRQVLNAAPRLRRALRTAGPDRLLAETDADGGAYDPALLGRIYAALGEILGLSRAETERRLAANAAALWGDGS